MGTITKDPGEPNCPAPAGYQAVLYNKDPQGNLYGYAYGVVDAGGKYAINPYDDLRLDPKPLAPYFIGIIAKNGYGAQEIQIALNEQGYMTQDLVLKKGQGAADPAGGTAAVTVLRSDNDAPITNANVVIEGAGLSASINENGIYTIKNIPAGSYLVTVTAYPYVPNSAQVTVSGGKTSPLTVKLAPIPTGKGVFYGYVTDAKGNNLVWAKVETGVISTQTDLFGFYTLEVPAGLAYNLKASLNNYNDAAVADQIINEGVAQAVNFTLTLKGGTKTGSFTGNVKNNSNQKPITGALVSDGVRSKLSDAGGNYTIAGVPEGNYTVTAIAQDFVPGVKSGQPITENNTTVVDFPLDPLPAGSAAVSGTVHDVKGNPLSGAVVGTAGITFTTGNDGVYALVIENAETKTYNIQASKDPDYASQTKGVPLAAGESKIVDFVLGETPAPEGTVSLLITRTDGNPDLSLSWTANAAPDIYYLPGDGTGKFSNVFAGCTKLDLTQPSPDPKVFEYHLDKNYILHKNQSGAGEKEVYYKGLVAGKDPAAFLSAAKAVGKLNITCDPGITWISVPILMGDPSLDNIIGTQLNMGPKNSADIILFKSSPQSFALNWAFLDGTKKKWLDYDNPAVNAQFNLSNLSGYYIWNRNQSKVITLVGAVPSTASLQFDSGAVAITHFGLGLPLSAPLSQIAGQAGLKSGADIILKKAQAGSNVLDWSFLDKDTNSWRDFDDPAAPTKFQIELPYSYYYWNRGKDNVIWERKL